MEMEPNNDYVNPSPSWSVPAASDTPPEETASLTWRDAVIPLLALGLSGLYWAVFALENLVRGYFPGLGVLLFVAAYYAAVFITLGPRFKKGGIAAMAASLLLALCCALYAHPGFVVLNCVLILLLSAMAAFSLSGQSRFGVSDLRNIPEAVRLSVLALFTRIGAPFRAASRLGKGGKGRLGRTVLAVALTAALLAVVLALLASADMVFGSFFARLAERLRQISVGQLLWKLIRTVALALFIASGLYFIQKPAPETAGKAAADRARHPLPFLLPALALDIVYIIFCGVQLRYLFGGAEAAAMAGGWAEYARTGFFQLAAVAGINLLLCLSGTDAGRFAQRGGAVLRAADGLMLVLTAVILVSAAYRMHLYIAAFGLSVLRLMTLWGMLVILAGLAAAGWKLYRPGFSFWKVFFPFALGTWCLLCLLNPAGRVADYNVDAYLAGRLETVDVFYLQELTTDAAPALKRLMRDADEYDTEAQYVLDQLTKRAREGGPLQWHVSFLEAEP